jgi:hypothetical protein
MRFVMLSRAGTNSSVSVNADKVTQVYVDKPDPPTSLIVFEKDHSIVVNGRVEDIGKLLAGEGE